VLNRLFFILRFTFVFAILFSTSIGLAQGSYEIKWFTDSDGLPQNTIRSIFKDKYGYIWLSTENGLVRYDGKEFKVFNNDNIIGVSGNRIGYFDGDVKADSVYMVNQFAELLLISKRNVKKIPDSLHFFTNNFAFDKNTLNFYNFYGHSFSLFYNPNDTIQQLHLGKSKYYLALDDNISEYGQDNKLVRNYKFPFTGKTQIFLFDDDLYILNDLQNLFLLKDGIISPVSFDKDFPVNKTIHRNTATNQFFLRTENKLYLIEDLKKEKITTKLLLESFNSNIDPDRPNWAAMALLSENFKSDDLQISAAFWDTEEEILYLGSFSSGLGILKKQSFSNLTHDNKQLNIEYALAKLNDSTIITSGGLIIQNKKIINKTDKFLPFEPFNIIVDEQKNIYMVLVNTVYLMQQDDNQHYQIKKSWYFNEPIASLRLHEDGKLWIGTKYHIEFGRGVLYSLDTKCKTCSPEKILEVKFDVSVMEKINKETFLIGSTRAAYKVSLLKGGFTETVPIIDEAEIRSIYKEQDNFWITSYDKGFFLYRNNKVTSFPLDKNKYLATSHCIVEDQRGYFWITTNKGLFQVKKEKLYAYADGKTENVYYQYYDKSYGLLSSEFNGGCYPCGIKLDNNIYFPSFSGIVSFNPLQIPLNSDRNGVYIDEVEIDGKKQFFTDTIIVDRKFERIKLFISSPFYGHPYNMEIEVKLGETEQQNWVPIDNDNSISYTSLIPGKYTLTARKFSGFENKYEYKHITIIIPPAFWQTWWFKIILYLLTIILIVVIIRMRTQYIKSKNIFLQQEIEKHTKQLKATVKTLTSTKGKLKKQLWFQKNMMNSISHDLKTPMKYLAITSKYVYENHNKTNQEEYENIEHIYNSSTQLVDFIDKLLIYAKANTDEISDSYETFNLYDKVEECIIFFKLTAKSNNNVIHNDIPKDLYVKLNKPLFIIIAQNLIDNALKNTFNGIIKIKAEVKDKILIFIEDTGKGMSDDKLHFYQNLFNNKIQKKENFKLSGFGFKLIRELLWVMKGKIILESTEGRGTKFTLIFPITKDFNQNKA